MDTDSMNAHNPANHSISQSTLNDQNTETDMDRENVPVLGENHETSRKKELESLEMSQQGDIAPQKPKDVAFVTLNSIRRIPVILSIMIVVILFSMDNTIVADVQPAIISSLGEINKLPWISVAYALGGVATNLFWGKLYGQFDNKYLFISAAILFEAGSALCGGAPTMNALIVGRTICGVGGVGVWLGALNITSLITTPSERPTYLAVVGLVWGIGTVIGPLIGGGFSDSSATWRWAFYINLCVGAVVSPVILFLVPSLQVNPGPTIFERVRVLDFVGAIVYAGANLCIVLAIAVGGSVFAWDSGSTIALFVVAGVLWISFVGQQWFSLFTTPERRLFPTMFLRTPEMLNLFVQTAAGQAMTFVPIYFLPLFFQFVRNDSSLGAGVRLLPFIVVRFAFVFFSGLVLKKTGLYMPLYLIGGVLSLVGSVLLHTISAGTALGPIYGYQIILGVGTGLFSQAGFAVAQAKVAPKLIAPAVAFIGVAQLSAIALSLAISNSIFINQATDKISTVVPGESRSDIQAAISGARGSAIFNNLDMMQRTRVLGAIVDSIDEVLIMVIAGAALSTLLAVFLSRERLYKK